MVLSLALTLMGTAGYAISDKEASDVFQVAKKLAHKDGGKLWGKSLEGPILLLDIKSHQVVANQADGQGALKSEGAFFRGEYPENGAFGNTALEWNGVRWTMLVWPLTGDKQERARLVMHESFHRIQPQLKWKSEGFDCPHLAEMQARILLQLEYRALAEALASKDGTAARDALAFRQKRWSLYPKAAIDENALELNEGIAEYTGMKLSGTPVGELRKQLAARLKHKENAESYSRSFCYETGPAYGLLLDAKSKSWRKQLVAEWNLTDLAAKYFGAAQSVPSDKELEALYTRYSADELTAQEQKREIARQDLIKSYMARFVSGPVIELDLTSPQVSFNPTNLFPLGDEGTVYPTMTVSDQWGKLEVVSGGALMKNWKLIRVPVPASVEGSVVKGDGWTLTIAAGWSAKPGKRLGDWTIAKD